MASPTPPTPPPLPASALSPAAAIDFALLVGALKRTPRTGWVRSGVPAADPLSAESISDHSHRMSTLALIAALSGDGLGGESGGGGGGSGGAAGQQQPPLDVSRCVRMAVVHDIAEAIVGDITPHCGVTEEDKHAREAAAIDRIAALLSQTVGGGGGGGGGSAEEPPPSSSLSPAARDVRDLWLEYEQGQTREARLVKDLDRLEMLVQALEYERANFGGGRAPLQSFFDGCRGKWRTPLGEAWAAEIEPDEERSEMRYVV